MLSDELVRNHLRGAITEALVGVADEVLKALETRLTTAKDREGLAQVGERVRAALEGTADDDLARELEEELMRELSQELSGEVARELSQDLAGEVARDLSGELRREVERELAGELRHEVERQLSQAVSEGLGDVLVDGKESV